MYVELECTYCGYKCNKKFYNKESIKNSRCDKCNDRHLVARDIDTYDYYVGCPKFPQTDLLFWEALKESRQFRR